MTSNRVVDELNKAVVSLQESMILYSNSLEGTPERKAFRDACIQRFEYCLELSWKTSMKLLGSSMSAAKPAIRDMARNNLIDNPVLWLSFVDACNKTSHSYDENVAALVFKALLNFCPRSISSS